MNRRLLLLTLLVFISVPLVAQPVEKPESGTSTPRGAVRLFIDSCREGDFEQAARTLDLRFLPPAQRSRRGPELARQFKFVLDQKIWIDYDAISDKPEGSTEYGTRYDRIGEISLHGNAIGIYLVRLGGSWYFAGRTVRKIPALYREYGPGLIERFLPETLLQLGVWEIKIWQLLGLPIVAFMGLFIALVLNIIAGRVFARVARRTPFEWDDQLLATGRQPTVVFLGILITWLLLKPLRLSVPAQEIVDAIFQTMIILALIWLLIRLVEFLALTLQASLTEGVDSDLKIRGVRTQVIVLRRIANIMLFIIGAALILIQFEVVRKVGMSLLASAGIAGIVIGFAAQKSISSILAGIQLAFTQPIRIGDTVIIENEWGWIEEINLTYVVVKVWDLRRLVIPITRFLDQPFQNWTKVSPEIMGTVYIYADYSVPVNRVREELQEYVGRHRLWDQKVCGLQVTDAGEKTIALRALVSAADSGKLWDLRCDVREHLVSFLQELEGGRFLPRHRLEGEREEGSAARRNSRMPLRRTSKTKKK